MNTKKNELQEQVSKALLALGKHGRVRIKTHEPAEFCKYDIYVDDEWFGLFDANRSTFED